MHAIQETKKQGRDFRAYAPFYNHDFDDCCSDKRSDVRKFNLVGAILGCTAGFSLAILCSLDWPLRTSAKDIVSIPGFIVIGYEWTILWGALFTLLGILVLGKLPDFFPKVGYDPRFSQDKFGVVVGCNKDSVDAVSEYLKAAGADEVQVRSGM
jgi:molybdopterin-containing oxidoreductase family membrane subunit